MVNHADQQKYTELIWQRSEDKYLKTGKRPLVYLKTFGCQQNVSDGEKIGGMLTEMGYAFASSPENADLVLFNTCAVRENAENRVFGNVGALVHPKRRNPEMVIGVCGCMMQQPHIAEKMKKSFPHVNLVFGTHAMPRLPEMLSRVLETGGRVFDIAESAGEIVEDLPLRREGDVKAWLPIMYGCDNFCTYCVVPLVRGRERSREPERILEEARSLVEKGYKEITLLGQNVNSYGKGLDRPMGFAGLLGQLCQIPGDFRIRFMTSHPKDCTRELIDTIAEQPKICSHIHLPVQSGSDRVLAAMNRKYTAAEYRALIQYAKQRIPGVSFTSDIIVGFPGETEEDFAKTLELVEAVGYHALFMFQYSKRAGTKAAGMENQTTREEKSQRFQRLQELQQRIGTDKHREMVGSTVVVLADGVAKDGDGFVTGRTESNSIVNFKAPAGIIGQFVKVRITRALNWALEAEWIED